MPTNHTYRSDAYRKVHGEPARVYPVEDGVSIEAFAFDFSSEEDVEDPGYVLVTNGMSDRRMHLDAEAEEAAAEGEVKPRAELLWYVRELDPRYIANLRWLASFPFLDTTWLGFGHTIPMPEPIFGSALTTYLLLTPILHRHQELGDALEIDGDAVDLLTVHLLTPAEYALKKDEGTDAILDLFDECDYPLVLDESRPSLV